MPDYIRTRVLLKSLDKLDHTSTTRIINKHVNFLRYFEVILKLIKMRIFIRPDIYILGFRGHEIYWLVRLITLGKPIIFDEFINVHDWLIENNKLSEKNLISKIAFYYVRAVLKSAKLVLTDTILGAESSSKTYGISIEKYRTIYVGEDEDLFKTTNTLKPLNMTGVPLEVFFYGNMAPLHGVEYILNAAVSLKEEPVHFRIIGGKGKPEIIRKINDKILNNQLDNVTYETWVDFDKLTDIIRKSDLCLGGPFGGTSQAKRVITGKTFQFLASSKATVIGKINEDIELVNHENCIIAEQASTDSLVEAISWAMNNRKKLGGIGKNGRELFDKKFATDVVALQLKRIVEDAS